MSTIRVAVCCKGVPIDPQTDSVSVADGDILFPGCDLKLDEVDDYAVEEAVHLKSAYQAETVAITLGPLRAQEVLFTALAKGIDRAVRVDGQTNRPELLAHGLIPVLRSEQPQLILIGVQSENVMGGELGIFLAQGLGMAQAHAVTEIKHITDDQVTIIKELGGGSSAEVSLRLPAVLCVQSGIRQLRYVSVMKRKQARSQEIESGGKFDLAAAREAHPGLTAYQAREVWIPEKEGGAEMITGSRAEITAKILEIIRRAT